MIVGLDFLSSINERIICINDGNRKEFANGQEMKEYYSRAAGQYALQRIQIEDGVIVISIGNKSENFT